MENIKNSKTYISLQQQLQDLTNKVSQINKTIDEENKEVNSIKIVDDKTFQNKKVKTLHLIKLIDQQISLSSKVTYLTFKLKKIELADNTSGKLTDKNLYSYIQFIESTFDLKLVPFNFFIVRKIKKIIKHKYLKSLKLNYIENVVIKKANKAQKIYYENLVKKLKSNIEYYDNYINNINTSFINKYHAKYVKRLEQFNKFKDTTKYSSNHLIDFKDVIKYYNNGAIAFKVLKDINLQIDRGEFVVILGPSGSGKTTLLNIISGMDTASSGTTIVNNKNLIHLNSTELTKFRKETLGYIFQQYGLLPNLTVKENVEIGSNLQANKSKRLDIDDLLKNIGIYEFKDKYPKELSGGQQQRVSIARSMAKNPDIIFGDEPTGAIDESMSKQIMQLFVNINKKYKTTVIIVTHNPIFVGLATMVIHVGSGSITKITRNQKPKNVDQLNWSMM